MYLTASIHTVLPDVAAGADAPQWLHLMPGGTFKGADGRGPYKLTNPAGVITASMAGGKLAIDENHSTDLAAPRGEASPACGWIVELQAREDGLWGRVEWNDSGKAIMANRSYRGISPTFLHAKDGTVQQLLRAALTNNPNFTQLRTLHSTGNDMDLTALRTKLGLSETADMNAILAAIDAREAAVTQASQAPAQISAMAAQIVGLETKLSMLDQEGKKVTATAVIDTAIRDGKPINALRDYYITRHMADAAGVERELAALPSINGTTVTHAVKPGDPAGDGMDELTADDRDVIAKMNLDPKKFAANKAAMKKGRS